MNSPIRNCVCELMSQRWLGLGPELSRSWSPYPYSAVSSTFSRLITRMWPNAYEWASSPTKGDVRTVIAHTVIKASVASHLGLLPGILVIRDFLDLLHHTHAYLGSQLQTLRSPTVCDKNNNIYFYDSHIIHILWKPVLSKIYNNETMM